MKIKVLVVEPNRAPYEKEIEDGLESLQKEVGGYIQAIYPFEEPVAVICNDEGKLEGLPLNRALRDSNGEVYDLIAGTFLIAGLTEDSFGSLSEEYMKKFSERFAKAEVFMNYEGRIMTFYMDPEPAPEIPMQTEEPFKADDTANIMVALTNLGKYNEGELVFKWIHLPITDQELNKALKAIGVDGKEYEEYFITDYDCYVDGVSDKLGEYTSIRDLNALAERFDCMSSHEIKHFEAIMEAFGASDIAEMINITHNLECWDFLPDITSAYDLGWYWVEESGCYNTDSLGALANYIDYEGFGRDISFEQSGQFIDEGYVYQNGNRMKEVYDPVNGYDEAFDVVTERMLEEER